MKRIVGAVAVALAVSSVGLAVPAMAVAPVITGSIALNDGGFGTTAYNSGIGAPPTYTIKTTAPTIAAGTYNEILQTEGLGTAARVNSVTAPQGYTVYYKNAAGNWSTTVPALITGVKAVGTVTSSGPGTGSASAQQMWSGSNSYHPSVVKSLHLGINGSGDGWDVSFDAAHTRMYNVYHHGSPSAIDCHLIGSGARCAGFPRYFGDMQTNHRPHALVASNGNIYVAGNRGSAGGFSCVTSAGASCGWVTAISSIPTSGGYNNFVGGNVEYNGMIFGFVVGTGKIGCYNILTSARCAGEPNAGYNIGLAPGGISGWQWASDSVVTGGKLFVTSPNTGFGSTGNAQVSCLNLTTLAKCSGTWPQAANGFLLMSNITGYSSIAVCTVFDAAWCYDATGSSVTAPAGLDTALGVMTAGGPSGNVGMGTITTQDGVKWIWSRGTWYSNASANPALMCWDASTHTTCTNFPITSQQFLNAGAALGTTYSVTADPAIAHCVWSNSDQHELFSWDTSTGTLGCTGASAASDYSFTAKMTDLTPRMSCSAGDNVSSWGNLIVASDTGTTTSYSISVLDSSGKPITGWQNMAPTTVNGVPTLNLSGLSTTLTGPSPSFQVTAAGFGSSGSISLALSKVSSTPELCITVRPAVVTCPSLTALAAGTNPSALAATLVSNFTATDVTDSTRTSTAGIEWDIAATNPSISLASCEVYPKNPTYSGFTIGPNSYSYTLAAPSFTGGAPASDMKYYEWLYFDPMNGDSRQWLSMGYVTNTYARVGANTVSGNFAAGRYCIAFTSRNSAGDSYSMSYFETFSAGQCVILSSAPQQPVVSQFSVVKSKAGTTSSVTVKFSTGYTGLANSYYATITDGSTTVISNQPLTLAVGSNAGYVTLTVNAGLSSSAQIVIKASNSLGDASSLATSTTAYRVAVK